MANGLDALPVTVLLATEPGTPVTVLHGNAALRMAIVDLESIRALGAERDKPGVYILLDPVALDGGVRRARREGAPACLRDRLRQQAGSQRFLLMIGPGVIACVGAGLVAGRREP